MLTTDQYVACLVLQDRRVLVVGEGPMSDEKVEGLRACGARVEVVDPQDYDDWKLAGAFLVIAAVSDRTLGERIYEDAERRSMLVNVADVPDLCNFILPAISRMGPLTFAVSTAGASPALAKRIRREAAERFDMNYARLAEILDELRPWARETLPTYEARRDFFDGIVNGDPDPIALLRAGAETELTALIERAKSAPA